MTSLTEADRAQLREMIERDWIEAALARDYDALLDFFSEDLVYMAPDQPMLRGKDELRGFLEAFPQISRFTQSLLSATGDHELAALQATADSTMEVDGQEVSSTGKFLATVTKDGGRWLFTAVCYNLDEPLG